MIFRYLYLSLPVSKYPYSPGTFDLLPKKEVIQIKKEYAKLDKNLRHSNPISRFWQKQRIKKQYAKTLKAGGKAKKTAEATAKAAKKTAQETKRATRCV